jgi:hypothetical protein
MLCARDYAVEAEPLLAQKGESRSGL